MSADECESFLYSAKEQEPPVADNENPKPAVINRDHATKLRKNKQAALRKSKSYDSESNR
jgi:hypothetical protein